MEKATSMPILFFSKFLLSNTAEEIIPSKEDFSCCKTLVILFCLWQNEKMQVGDSAVQKVYWAQLSWMPLLALPDANFILHHPIIHILYLIIRLHAHEVANEEIHVSPVHISSPKKYTAELWSSYDLESCCVTQLRSKSPDNIFTTEILKELQLQLHSLATR